jgi:arylformamidase
MHGVVICEVSLDGQRYIARLDQPQRLHLPLQFDVAAHRSPQPNHFGAPRARAWPLQLGGFTGDTRQGGSCNALTVELTPHCNGTHTESAGHLTRERLSVDELLDDALLPATLVSITPAAAGEGSEGARHSLSADDRVITAAALDRALNSFPVTPALVLRTLPNTAVKCSRTYEGISPAPFLTLEAARWIVDRGVRHLLVDMPSLDRAHDEGYLGAHRVFWGMSAGADSPATSRRGCTVTEMIYAADSVADGLYLLNLQVAPFDLDAAPARVVVYPLESA